MADRTPTNDPDPTPTDPTDPSVEQLFDTAAEEEEGIKEGLDGALSPVTQDELDEYGLNDVIEAPVPVQNAPDAPDTTAMAPLSSVDTEATLREAGRLARTYIYAQWRRWGVNFDRADYEDVRQEVVTRVCQIMYDGKRIEFLPAVVHCVTTRQLFDRVRRETALRRDPRQLGDRVGEEAAANVASTAAGTTDPAKQIQHEADKAWVESEIECLRVKLRAVMRLLWDRDKGTFDRITQSEAAHLLGIKEGTVKSRKSTALAILRRRWDEYNSDEGSKS